RGESAQAWLHRGRWVVQCPHCRADVQLAFERTPLFMCSACWNEDTGGAWRPVAFPEERAQIEALLTMRRRRQHQNWTPGEGIDDLLGQNRRLAADGLLEAADEHRRDA